MTLSPRQLLILCCFFRFGPLTSTQIRDRFLPNDKSGRGTRRALEKLRRLGLLMKYTMHVLNPQNGASLPVHDITDRGREILSVAFGSDGYLVRPLGTVPAMHLFHATCVAGMYMTLDDAVAAQDLVEVQASYREHEVINKEEPDRAKQFSLFTHFCEKPRLVCQPDLGFALNVRGHVAAFYIEFETGSSGPRWVAQRKAKGYSELAKKSAHKRHFPKVTVSAPYVLAVGPNPNYRDALIRHMKSREGNDLWRFASVTDVSPDTFLFEPIWYRVGSDAPYPLVKR